MDEGVGKRGAPNELCMEATLLAEDPSAAEGKEGEQGRAFGEGCRTGVWGVGGGGGGRGGALPMFGMISDVWLQGKL